MNRRELLIGGGAALAGAALARPAWGCTAESGGPMKRVLMFTKSSGFEHSAIQRSGPALSFAEQRVTDLGAKHGFEVTATKDGTAFTPENLAKYDGFFFYTTGDLTTPGTDGNPPMTPAGKAAFLEAIRGGKGYIGTHAAADTFHTPPELPDRATRYVNHGDDLDPYLKMLGAEFIKHGPQQVSTVKVIDPKFPGFPAAAKAAGANAFDRFSLMEEWYTFSSFQPDLHVLLVQQTEGMKGTDYQRPPYPSTWARKHGKGRVFYTSMGHREDVWTNPIFESILLGGIAWALGSVNADFEPNLETAAPGHKQIQPKG